MDALCELYTSIQEQLNPCKTYVATLSMGSRLTYHMLNRHPEFIADAFLLCCGASSVTDVNWNVDISQIRNRKIIMISAYNDDVVLTADACDTFNTLAKNGNDVSLTLNYEGYGHWIWQYVYDNPKYMEMLFGI